MSPKSHSNANYDCVINDAFIRDVPNAFVNSQIQSQRSSYESVWLGLTCTGNNFTDCRWDSGLNITETSYSNFAPGNPSYGPGSYLKTAVLMSVADGKWYSADWSAGPNASYICETASTFTCGGNSTGTGTVNLYDQAGVCSYTFLNAPGVQGGICVRFVNSHPGGAHIFEGEFFRTEGYIADYAPIDPNNTYSASNMVPTLPSVSPAPPTTSCFYDLYDSGVFKTLDYPRNLPAGTYCEFRFHSSRSKIALRFTDFYVNGMLFIYEGYSDSNTYLYYNVNTDSKSISNDGDDFTSQSEVVTLTMSTSQTGYRGFYGVFSSI